MTEILDRSVPAQTPWLPPLLQHSPVWTDAMVAEVGIRIEDAPFVSVGGGMGSFVTVDYLRAAGGVAAADIKVLSNLDHPWKTYEYLTRVSQLPRNRRIRSDAASRPDNLWGFPSYAMQEAVRDRTLRPLLQVLLEPVYTDFYTPRLGAVLEGIEREADRIRYWDMLVKGEVWMVRRRAGGGYFAVLAPRPADVADGTTAPGLVAYRCRDVHVAVGYSGLKFTPEMQRFRLEMNDYHHVVNGYQDHEHVYEALRSRPGTVLVRGGGIVTSAVLERLLVDRARYGTDTRIVHLFRTYVEGRHGRHPWLRRPGGDGFAYQGFNYPKSAWGGQLKARMRKQEGSDRVRTYEDIGGTTTAWRQHWQRRLQEARKAGWYQSRSGSIEDLWLDGDEVVARVSTPEGDDRIRADYVIDCTGLDADVAEHRVLADLLRHSGAGRNPLGRLDVEPSFELRGAANGSGRIYVTGAASFGGYFPGVDTFLGLQISAQEVVDDMARRGNCSRPGPLRSTAGWLRWVRGKQI
jgi:hypothetical protein